MIPDRNIWYKVEYDRNGSTWYDRQRWCDKNCKARWLPSSIHSYIEFESEKDAAMFALRWS